MNCFNTSHPGVTLLKAKGVYDDTLKAFFFKHFSILKLPTLKAQDIQISLL